MAWGRLANERWDTSSTMEIYAGSIILTELLMAAMWVHTLFYSGFTREQKGWYLLTFAAIMVCAIAECFALLFDARGPEYIPSLTILTVVQFSLTPMLPVFFSGALGMRKEARAAGMVLSINVIAEAFSAFTKWIFYFDANGTYIRGNYYFIYVLFYSISLLYLIFSMIRIGKHFEHRDSVTIAMVFIILAVTIVQLLVFEIYTTYTGIGICACLCYIYYNDLIQEDTLTEVTANQERLSSIQEHIISGLANLIESRDLETGEHVARTSAYVKTLAECARADGVYADVLDDHYIMMLQRTAPLHDIGKITVPDHILQKPGKLTPEEFEEMKLHAAVGGDVVRQVLQGVADEEYMAFASDIATYHHERWDGAGYPKGLAGEEIPLPARIMAVADVFDALISERCYKKPMPLDKAFAIIEEETGTHFDPQLGEVFLRHREEFIIRKV